MACLVPSALTRVVSQVGEVVAEEFDAFSVSEQEVRKLLTVYEWSFQF